MKRANDKRPACLRVTKYGPDSLGTRYIEISVGVQSDADDTIGGARYVARPQGALAGVPMLQSPGWLAIRFYSNVRDNPQNELTFDVSHLEAHEGGGVSLYDARAMVACLTAVHKRLDVQKSRYGYSSDFAENAMRLAAAFKIGLVAVDWDLYRQATGYGPGQYEEKGNYKWIGDTRDMRSFFDQLARIYVCRRCLDCNRPIAEGRNKCHECTREAAQQ